MTSPSGSTKASTFNAFQGVHQKWEDHAQLRHRVRDFQRFILEEPPKGSTQPLVPEGSVCKTAGNLKFNQAALEPLLAMCKGTEGVPCIDTLVDEIQKFYGLHNLSHPYGVLRNDAWSVRYLFGGLKSYLWKGKPPRATWLTLGLKIEAHHCLIFNNCDVGVLRTLLSVGC
eukprot:Skav222598  [mRNA]  locus=scaffold1852:127512:128024:+ [translate_table: standard]